MNDGIVVEVGWTAREVDLITRDLERLANEHGSVTAFETLIAMRNIVREHMPEYVLASLGRMETFVAAHGIRRFEMEWAEPWHGQ